MHTSKFIFSSLFSFLFTVYLFSQNPISVNDSIEIMNVMSLQEKSWNKGDIDSFMDGKLQRQDILNPIQILKLWGN